MPARGAAAIGPARKSPPGCGGKTFCGACKLSLECRHVRATGGQSGGPHAGSASGYAGDKLKRRLKKIGRWTVEIIERSDKAKGFEVLPRRWVVERTFAWLGRCRRLAKDVEKSIASAEAWIMIAHIRLITRQLARYQYR